MPRTHRGVDAEQVASQRLWCPCSASQATSNQISNCWYFPKCLDHRVPVGLAPVPWMECGSRWIIFWALCNFSWFRSSMTLPCRLVLIIGVSIVQWRSPFVKNGFENSLVSSVGAPILDEHGHPTSYQQHICEWLRPHQLRLPAIWKIFCWKLVWNMALQGGKGLFFSPSEDLQQLRVARRQTVEQHLRKDLSLQIRQIHRQELKQWKSNQVNAFLGNPSRWKDLRDYLPRPSMLEALFVSTTAKTHALDRTWVGFIGTTFSSSAAEKWEMWRRTWFDSWIA